MQYLIVTMFTNGDAPITVRDPNLGSAKSKAYRVAEDLEKKPRGFTTVVVADDDPNDIYLKLVYTPATA